MRNYTFAVLFFCSILSVQLFAQGTQIEFGKNRVQYHQEYEEWLKYESTNFITYWYGEGRYIGQTVVQMAEMDYDAIQNILEHRMNDRIEVIVYKDLTDLKQSNIGSEETFVNTGGQTKIVGNKIFVYFNGDHTHLRKQLREGIANVYMNAMLFGSSLQEIVQNAVMLNLPEWFKEGLVAYVGEEWNTEIDNQLRDFILRKEYKDFDALALDHPRLAGHSMWYYISQHYGRSTVSNLLYLTRINRSTESGFLYVLGTSYRRTTQNWKDYFEKRYAKETELMVDHTAEKVKFKNKRKKPVTTLKLSPDGQKLVYVTNEIGKYKVYLQNLQTGKREVIHKGGFRNPFQATDYEYPLIAWSPNNFELVIVYEKQDIVRTLRYDLNTKKAVKDVIPNQFHRIYSVDFIDPNNLVFSAAVRGLSDIYIYSLLNRQTRRITSDFWDDLDATVVNLDGRKGILFASNRPDTLMGIQKLDTILPLNNFDLFFYDYYAGEQELSRVTRTPNANERSPVAIDTTWFAYRSDESGIYNRRIGFLESYVAYQEKIILLRDSSEIILHADSSLTKLDSSEILSVSFRPVYKKRGVTFNQTNYKRNLLSLSTSARSKKQAELIYNEGDYHIYVSPINLKTRATAQPTYFYYQQSKSNELTQRTRVTTQPSTNIITQPSRNEPIEIADTPVKKTEPDTNKIDVDNYLFQSEFDEEEEPPAVVIEEDDGEIILEQSQEEDDITLTTESLQSFEKRKVMEFRPGRITPYRLKFRTDFVTTQLDNSLLFGGLDNFAGDRQDSYTYPPPGILLKANFKDLFEDYEFEGGVRLPTTFNGAEYFLLFDDKKKRLDKRYAFYRRALKFTEEGPQLPRKYQEVVLLGQYQLRYPLDIFRSLRATFTVRGDKRIQLATDRASLEVPTQQQQRAGVRLEYVFDNTLDVALNIKNGTRYKIFAEVVKRFQVDLLEEVQLSFNDGIMTVIGVDARHYQRLDRHSIIAARFAASTSFGSERILHYLGGVDNWLFPQFNNEIPFPSSGNFAFQTFTNNLRGFRTNIRNGNSYALINTELRVPIFKYLSRRIRSNFFRNFQAIGFFDVGTAWEGRTPFSKENPLNTIFIQNPPTVNVKVNYFRDPIVAGYGFGARAMLFGYFIRVDYAWGIETRVVQDPIFYLSIGMDF
ncbi:MAG: hypothetical protein AAF990_16575 [Bacteroidota bacterium]